MRFLKSLIALLTLTFLLVQVQPAFAQQASSSAQVQGKHIEIDLTHQELFAYDGDTLIYDFPISSGLYYPTPTGTYHVYVKLISTRMVGGNPALGTHYDLPNVPYTMYFFEGYGIHGAYWHNNFGHPMSHGCVNLPVEDSMLLYYWTDYSTPIHIYGITPAS